MPGATCDQDYDNVILSARSDDLILYHEGMSFSLLIIFYYFTATSF